MGFRDSNQPLVGFVHQIPQRTYERIIDIASTQFPDGGCYHQYQPLTEKGNNEIGQGFNDDPVWLIFGTTCYIKEIGDSNRTEMIAGKDAIKPGEAKTSWLTGTASWNFYAITQFILGIQPDYDGLRINPCIPQKWDGFEVTRKFRGATYQIKVVNKNHISKGVVEVIIDGKRYNSNLLPIFESGTIHSVIVEMG
jgi:cellobiose phosphorylase